MDSTNTYEVKEIEAKGEKIYVFEYKAPMNEEEHAKLDSFLDRVAKSLKEEGLGDVGTLVQQWKK
jgi:5,10-methylenetetrahydrofolate reductase